MFNRNQLQKVVSRYENYMLTLPISGCCEKTTEAQETIMALVLGMRHNLTIGEVTPDIVGLAGVELFNPEAFMPIINLPDGLL